MRVASLWQLVVFVVVMFIKPGSKVKHCSQFGIKQRILISHVVRFDSGIFRDMILTDLCSAVEGTPQGLCSGISFFKV